MDALTNFATSGLDCAIAIARFAYCSAVLAAEAGKVAYNAGKAARIIHNEGKAWVDAKIDAWLKTCEKAPATPIALLCPGQDAPTTEDVNPWDAPTIIDAEVVEDDGLALPAAFNSVVAFLPAAQEVSPIQNAFGGIRELRKAAKKAGIKGYSRKSKNELIAALAA